MNSTIATIAIHDKLGYYIINLLILERHSRTPRGVLGEMGVLSAATQACTIQPRPGRLLASIARSTCPGSLSRSQKRVRRTPMPFPKVALSTCLCRALTRAGAALIWAKGEHLTQAQIRSLTFDHPLQGCVDCGGPQLPTPIKIAIKLNRTKSYKATGVRF